MRTLGRPAQRAVRPRQRLDRPAAADQRWDAIYSIWGSLWFTDPDQLLPLVLQHQRPSGRLVFSHAPAVPSSHGVQGIYGTGLTARQVWLYR
jgi:hypothetical protein